MDVNAQEFGPPRKMSLSGAASPEKCPQTKGFLPNFRHTTADVQRRTVRICEGSDESLGGHLIIPSLDRRRQRRLSVAAMWCTMPFLRVGAKRNRNSHLNIPPVTKRQSRTLPQDASEKIEYIAKSDR
ncbi:hypothetical protein EVAR_30390_1 [Eumeta japonica]|uniref:Uncharacterized protein n=1 Tax=Eumeta variegata TaxID=151549 RepID=A0A4C1W5B8_EUMVA|nr:hypothetical protein EVAR_30390_1 [Eumeta japonica]